MPDEQSQPTPEPIPAPREFIGADTTSNVTISKGDNTGPVTTKTPSSQEQ